jgi:hypothetical protein
MKHNIIILYLILTALFCDISFPQGKTEPAIALIYPQLTKEVLYKKDNSFSPTDSWELFFLSQHFKYEMLNDNALSRIDNNVKVVIIPAMQVVDAEMIDEIGQILDEGKGVLITGNFAKYDEDGNIINPDYEKRIPGFEILPLKENDAISVNHSLNGNTPFGIGLKPGQKLLLNKEPELFFASDLSQDCNPLGGYFLSDGELPGLVLNSIFNGRLLWLGFNLEQLIGKNRNQLLLNSLNWLSSPAAFINEWPGNYSSAGLIYKNLEKSSDIDNSFRQNIKSGKINYFISHQIFEKSTYNLKDLADPGNINILWDDFYFSKLNYNEKLIWLNDIKSLFKQYSNQNYYGISSYGEFYDSSTYKLLTETGYSFIFSSGYSESFSIDYDSTNNIYLFTKTYVPGSDIESRLKFVIKSGGIFYVNIDSIQNNISDLLTNKRYWLTTFSDLLEWEIKRAHLELKINLINNDNYEIIIKNNGSSSVENAGIWISSPEMTGNMVLKNSGAAGKLTFDSEKKMYFLEVYSIKGYQEISFRISAPL